MCTSTGFWETLTDSLTTADISRAPGATQNRRRACLRISPVARFLSTLAAWKCLKCCVELPFEITGPCLSRFVFRRTKNNPNKTSAKTAGVALTGLHETLPPAAIRVTRRVPRLHFLEMPVPVPCVERPARLFLLGSRALSESYPM